MPCSLLAAADGIKGLSIDGDEVLLDGVALDQLSGQERLFFAVEVARRLNAKSKLLCVDGLEVLDAEHRRMFIERATKDGYQLIATRVADDGGDPSRSRSDSADNICPTPPCALPGATHNSSEAKRAPTDAGPFAFSGDHNANTNKSKSTNRGYAGAPRREGARNVWGGTRRRTSARQKSEITALFANDPRPDAMYERACALSIGAYRKIQKDADDLAASQNKQPQRINEESTVATVSRQCSANSTRERTSTSCRTAAR